MVCVLLILPHRRENPVFQPDYEHYRELQALCAVHCRERNAVVVAHIVGIAVKRHSLQIIGDGRRRIVLDKILDRRYQLVEVFQPRLAVVVVRKQPHDVEHVEQQMLKKSRRVAVRFFAEVF